MMTRDERFHVRRVNRHLQPHRAARMLFQFLADVTVIMLVICIIALAIWWRFAE